MSAYVNIPRIKKVPDRRSRSICAQRSEGVPDVLPPPPQRRLLLGVSTMRGADDLRHQLQSGGHTDPGQIVVVEDDLHTRLIRRSIRHGTILTASRLARCLGQPRVALGTARAGTAFPPQQPRCVA